MVALSGCASDQASNSCLTVGSVLPICYERYTQDGVIEDTDTEEAILKANEWWFDICNGGVSTCNEQKSIK